MQTYFRSSLQSDKDRIENKATYIKVELPLDDSFELVEGTETELETSSKPPEVSDHSTDNDQEENERDTVDTCIQQVEPNPDYDRDNPIKGKDVNDDPLSQDALLQEYEEYVQKKLRRSKLKSTLSESLREYQDREFGCLLHQDCLCKMCF
jgi:hypothetical protein